MLSVSIARSVPYPVKNGTGLALPPDDVPDFLQELLNAGTVRFAENLNAQYERLRYLPLPDRSQRFRLFCLLERVEARLRIGAPFGLTLEHLKLTENRLALIRAYLHNTRSRTRA